ncbi:MAG: ABC transporter substrate-binding protein [Acetatifactor sp.]|nr:ABC transporter substrate-binding protein [Acetatifactor sp.]
MKKKLAMILAGVMTLSLLTGCGEKAETGAEDLEVTENAAEESVESEETPLADGGKLSVMMSSGDYGAGMITQALETVAEGMGITLEFEVIPDDQMLTVTNTKLATGNGGDIILHNFGLTDISEKDLASLDGEWVGKITDTTYPLCVGSDGSVLKAPLGGESNMGFIYNKKVLEEAGVSLPIRNYEEFIAACELIKGSGKTPVYISNQETWTAQILLLCSMTSVFDGNPELIHKLTTNQVKPAEIPELVKLFENAISLKDLGYINEDYMSATNDMAFDALANGECAFYAQLDSAYSSLNEFYPDKIGDLGMMYIPLWDNEEDGYVLFGTATNYLSIVGNSENLDLAKAFVNKMVSEDGLKVYYDLIPGSAPYKDLTVELNANAFNREMREYAKTWPSLREFNNALYDGEPALSNFYGAFSERIQGMFSGISVEDTLSEWYKAYYADAAALRMEGF